MPTRQAHGARRKSTPRRSDREFTLNSTLTTLTIQAVDDRDHDRLVGRAGLIEGVAARLVAEGRGVTHRYEVVLLHHYGPSISTRKVTLTFDAQALAMLGTNLDGRAALAAAEEAILRTESDASTKH